MGDRNIDAASEDQVELQERFAAAERIRADAATTAAAAAGSAAAAEKASADAAEVRAKTTRDDAAAAASAAKALRDEAVLQQKDSAEALTKAVPNLSSLSQPTLTFTGDRDLRQSELIGLASESAGIGVGRDIARHFGGVWPPAPTYGIAFPARALEEAPESARHSSDPTLVVTSNVDVLGWAAEYEAWSAESTGLVEASTAARASVDEVLDELDEAGTASPGGSPGDRRAPLTGTPLDIITTVGAAAAQAVLQLASALQVDAEVHARALRLPELVGHAPIIGAIIRTPGTRRLVITHERLLPTAGAVVTEKLTSLTTERTELAAARAKVSQQATAERTVAVARKDASPSPLAIILTAAESTYTALLASFDELITRISAVGTAPVTKGEASSPVQRAYRIQPLLAALDTGFLLVLPAADVSSDQVVLKRRILSPRIIVSGYCRQTFLLLEAGKVVAAGGSSGRAAFVARLGWFGVRWDRVAE